MKVKGRTFAWLMASPAVLLLLAFGVVPLIWAVRTSLFRFSPNPFLPPEFYGFGNLRDLVADPQFLDAVRITAIVATAGLLCEFLFGFILALALNEIRRFRGVIVSLLLIPAAIAPIVAGIVWWMLFNTRFGAINSILQRLFGMEPIEWTIKMPTALIAIIVAVVWQWTPFVAVILLGGLTTIPPTVIEAATIDGAHSVSMIRHITLPFLRPFFLVAGLLMIIEIVRLYEVPFFITQGGPGNATVVEGVYLFKLAFGFFDLGRSSVLSLLLVIALSIIAALYVRLVSGGALRR